MLSGLGVSTCLLLMAAQADAVAAVPVPMQRSIQGYFAPTMVLPALALWRFENIKPYGGGGDLVCGEVNYQDSTRQYLGYLGFYAVVRNGKVTMGGIRAANEAQDPTGAFEFAYSKLCSRK